jgi:hypothetical protein
MAVLSSCTADVVRCGAERCGRSHWGPETLMNTVHCRGLCTCVLGPTSIITFSSKHLRPRMLRGGLCGIADVVRCGDVRSCTSTAVLSSCTADVVRSGAGRCGGSLKVVEDAVL